MTYDRIEVTVRKTENSINQYVNTGRRFSYKKWSFTKGSKWIWSIKRKKKKSMMVIIMKLEERRRQTEEEDILDLHYKEMNN